MAITEPLTLPADGLSEVTFNFQTAIAKNTSPFDLTDEYYLHTGRKVTAEIDVVPIDTTLAAGRWEAFLLQADGGRRVFLLQDPTRDKPNGSAVRTVTEREIRSQDGQAITGQNGDPLLIQNSVPREVIAPARVLGHNAERAEQLRAQGFRPSIAGVLLPGDRIQLGSGADSRLHVVLTAVDTDARGEATIDVWPPLRATYTDGTAITLENPAGAFRLQSNVASWKIRAPTLYGFNLTAVEAL